MGTWRPEPELLHGHAAVDETKTKTKTRRARALRAYERT